MPEKRAGSLTFWLEPDIKQAFFERCKEKGLPSKVVRELIKKFLAGEVKVVLPGTAEREI
jgi:hypothetical protein